MIGLIEKKVNLDKSRMLSEGLTTFLNPVSYLKARNKTHTYQQFDHLLADGWLFVAAMRIAGIHIERYSFDMTSLASILFDAAITQNKSVYFLGAKPDEIDKFIATISKHFPQLNVIGYRDGYFKNADERQASLAQIKELGPDVVIAGLGVPLQEQFLVDLKNVGWKGCGYTCGGFIHQTTEKLKYYPNWINRYHLRMPYRFIKEPHFRKRLPDYFKFLFIFAKDYWKFRSEIPQTKFHFDMTSGNSKSK